jgi:hypothetical protein
MCKRNKTAVLVKDMFQEIEVCGPVEDIYHIFDIEEKQSVIKINGKLLVGYEKKLESYLAVVVCLGLYYL